CSIGQGQGAPAGAYSRRDRAANPSKPSIEIKPSHDSLEPPTRHSQPFSPSLPNPPPVSPESDSESATSTITQPSQPSPRIAFASSHSSPACTIPLPHITARG